MHQRVTLLAEAEPQGFPLGREDELRRIGHCLTFELNRSFGELALGFPA